MSEFIFDEATHTYRLDNVLLPSVTTIIDNALHTYAGVPKELLERAARFGTAMHSMVKLYLADDLDEDSLDEPLEGCLLAFKLFEIDYPELRASCPIVEMPGYHPKLKYAGTPDLKFDDAIIDLKSRPVNLLSDPMQTVAYDRMDGKREFHYILELRQNGTYELTRVNSTKKLMDQSWSRFRYLLDYYKMSSEIRRWK